LQEEDILEKEYEFGLFHGGSRYKRKNTRIEKGESFNDPKRR
jgi:hypothetical protein